jgi:hypothetical protein
MKKVFLLFIFSFLLAGNGQATDNFNSLSNPSNPLYLLNPASPLHPLNPANPLSPLNPASLLWQHNNSQPNENAPSVVQEPITSIPENSEDVGNFVLYFAIGAAIVVIVVVVIIICTT